ncbi:MAG: guanine deaminase [Pseudomonadales bacterium]
MRAIRSRAIHWASSNHLQPEYLEDAVLLTENGLILDFGPAARFEIEGFDLNRCEHHPRSLMLPGWIDAHLHFPQVDVLASYGTQLLEWLEQYTFPAEAQYRDAEFSRVAAESFLDLLLSHGTTSAFAFCSSHKVSATALFEAGLARQMRLVAGKVLMDQNAPEALLDTPAIGAEDSAALIQQYHGRDRLGYALTPRFSGTSTSLQLAKTGDLARQFPEVWIQSHLSENQSEIEWIRSVHPQYQDYLESYEAHGLVSARSLYGHCIHLSDSEIARMASKGGVAVFCPSSNLFLGSGLMPFERLKGAGVPLAIGSDIGGGTSISLLKTLADAYKVCQLQGYALDAYEAFFMLTKGNAVVTQQDRFIGDFRPGREADWVLLDPARVPLIERRVSKARSIKEELFVYMILGDEQLVAETTVFGQAFQF